MNLAMSRTLAGWLGSVVAIFATHMALAQEPVVDPPGRVARLSLIEGRVSLAAENEEGKEERTDAVLNRPLTSGDKLWVENAGRAELQIGSSTIHLNEDTSFSIIELDDDVMQVSITDGAATVRVNRLSERETIQVETPNSTVRLLHPGEYHFEVDSGSDRTIVKARSGEAEVVGRVNSYKVTANEQGEFMGLDNLTAHIYAIGPRTAFESWANDRDRRDNESQSTRYVSGDVIGYEDLDDNGDWIDEPEYGHVWRPRYVANDWAPYRYGHWAWVGPWGWTWIDDARWGFAPFHYGRWAYLSSRWCWVPGPRHLRPVYAPAFVSWVGGSGVSVSVGFGSGVGWFPLGPRELYVPYYRHTPRYVRYVNFSNTIIVNNNYFYDIDRGRYRDWRYRNWNQHGLTMIPRDQFVGGRPIGDRRTRVEEGQLRELVGNVRPPHKEMGDFRNVRRGSTPTSAPVNGFAAREQNNGSKDRGGVESFRAEESRSADRLRDNNLDNRRTPKSRSIEQRSIPSKSFQSGSSVQIPQSSGSSDYRPSKRDHMERSSPPKQQWSVPQSSQSGGSKSWSSSRDSGGGKSWSAPAPQSSRSYSPPQNSGGGKSYSGSSGNQGGGSKSWSAPQNNSGGNGGGNGGGKSSSSGQSRQNPTSKRQ